MIHGTSKIVVLGSFNCTLASAASVSPRGETDENQAHFFTDVGSHPSGIRGRGERSRHWRQSRDQVLSASHSHAKSAFIYAYVVSGQVESKVDDGRSRIYKAGESFYENPGSRHPISRNASKTEPARLLAVFIVDTDETELTTFDK
jgi:hypothetical protein